MNTSHLEADRNQEMVDLSPRPTPALLSNERSLNFNCGKMVPWDMSPPFFGLWAF